MSFGSEIRKWLQGIQKMREARLDVVSSSSDATNMAHRARYLFNVAKIDNGFLVFYTGAAGPNTWSGVGGEDTNIRYCKDLSELPDVLIGMNAQLRLNV
jgi:hypothetical protein